jgi:hypothetical protein
MTRRLIPLALALALLLAACSGDSGSATTTTLDTESQLLKFAACMRAEGIELPDPAIGSDGFPEFVPPEGFDMNDADAMDEVFDAVAACREYIEGLTQQFADIDLNAITDTLVEFADCMRDNGFDLPDPDFTLMRPQNGQFPNAGPFGNVDFDDPDFEAAFEACEHVIASLGVQVPGR